MVIDPVFGTPRSPRLRSILKVRDRRLRPRLRKAHGMNILHRNNVHVTGSAGPVLVYAHGFGCNQHMWDRVTPAFTDTHRQVLFDYVGCGQSDPTAFDATRYASLNGYAQDLIEVCDALALQGKVTFIGHSVSGSIGMLASIARPELFDRLIMIGPSPCFLNQPGYTGGFEREDLDGLLSLMEQNHMGWANHLAPVVAGASGGPAVSNTLAHSFCSTDPVMARCFAKTTFFSDNRADLPKVPCPSLILQHRQDALAPLSVGDYLHKHLKNSTLKVLDVKGHSAHMSNPDLVIEAIRTYLAGDTKAA